MSFFPTHDALLAARKPLLLAGRMSRSMDDWKVRITFAEVCGATVLSSTMHALAFPVDHSLHTLPQVGEKPSDVEAKLLSDCDLIVSLDWMDLARFLNARTGSSQSLQPHPAKIIHCSMDGLLANGWSVDHQALPMLLVVANNQSYFNDEAHQERMAIQRNRPRENKSVGQRMDNPPIDLGQIAAAQGFSRARRSRCVKLSSRRARPGLKSSMPAAAI